MAESERSRSELETNPRQRVFVIPTTSRLGIITPHVSNRIQTLISENRLGTHTSMRLRADELIQLKLHVSTLSWQYIIRIND
jgi:hypothetical protein